MSVFTYNEINLPYPHILKYNQSAIREESDTDWIGTKFDINVQSVINTDFLSEMSSKYAAAILSPADIMKAIRSDLMKPRRTLSVTFNGINIIPYNISRGMVDTDNGPKPIDCNVVQLTNTTFIITYSITATYWENNELHDNTSIVNKAGNNVLYNRWMEMVDINSLDRTTRTREGKYKIRSDNIDGIQADETRNGMAVVGVPNGFTRVSSNYTIEPNGLTIRYRVVDKEVFKMPPEPAFEAEGQYIESASKLGAFRFGEVRVVLRGSKRTHQDELVKKCVAIAASKLVISGADLSDTTNDKISLLEASAIKVNLYENEVEVIMKSRLKGTRKRIQGNNMDVSDLSFTPFSDGLQVKKPPYLPKGSAGYLLRAAAYFDPNLVTNELDQSTGQMTNGLVPGQAGANLET